MQTRHKFIFILLQNPELFLCRYWCVFCIKSTFFTGASNFSLFTWHLFVTACLKEHLSFQMSLCSFFFLWHVVFILFVTLFYRIIGWNHLTMSLEVYTRTENSDFPPPSALLPRQDSIFLIFRLELFLKTVSLLNSCKCRQKSAIKIILTSKCSNPRTSYIQIFLTNRLVAVRISSKSILHQVIEHRAFFVWINTNSF